MKKQWMTFACVLAVLMAMTGCSAVRAVEKIDAAEDRIEEKLDLAEEKLEDSIRKAVTPETRPPQTQPAAENPSGSVESSEMLTGDQALEIALDHLGFSADQVSGLRSEFEIDDGVPQFDIEFIRGDWKYEFEIQGKTGRILSYEKDHKYD